MGGLEIFLKNYRRRWMEHLSLKGKLRRNAFFSRRGKVVLRPFLVGVAPPLLAMGEELKESKLRICNGNPPPPPHCLFRRKFISLLWNIGRRQALAFCFCTSRTHIFRYSYMITYPANICLFKVNSGNTGQICEICSIIDV